MVYAAVNILLSFISSINAIAFMVTAAVISIGFTYLVLFAPFFVGVLSSVVYHISAFSVSQESVTVAFFAISPAGGVATGVVTVSLVGSLTFIVNVAFLLF
jgi:hypothetical protein